MSTQPEELVIDIDYLTGNEVIAIEDLADVPFDQLGAEGQKKGRLLVAIATVMKRREDPSFTFEQAGDLRIRLTDEVEAEDPTEPGVADD